MNKCAQCRLLVQDGLATCPSCGAKIAGATQRSSAPATGSATPSARARQPLGPRRTPPTAVIGIVLALIPICVNVIGVVLGIVALVQISKQPRRYRGRGLAIAAIVVGSLWLVLGLLAAIAIPNFQNFAAKAKQSEAKVLLMQVRRAQTDYYGRNGTYATTFEQLGQVPQVNRYAIFLANDSVQPATPYADPGLSFANETGYRAVAVGDVDGDPTLDVWVADHHGQLQHTTDDLED